MILFNQRDPRWCDYVYDKGYTIGKSGCVITMLANITALDRSIGIWAPKNLAISIKRNKGFDNGNLIWDKARDAIRLKAIEPWYWNGTGERPTLDFKRYYYFCRYINNGTGHFTNIVGENETQYILYDVWYGDFRTIDKSKVGRIGRVII